MVPGRVWDLALAGLSCFVLLLQGNLAISLPSPLRRCSRDAPLETAPNSRCLKSHQTKRRAKEVEFTHLCSWSAAVGRGCASAACAELKTETHAPTSWLVTVLDQKDEEHWECQSFTRLLVKPVQQRNSLPVDS